MIRRLPLVPTIIVAAAAALMIGLGIWQLQRARWKDALIAQYAAAQKLPPMAWPTAQLREDQLPLFMWPERIFALDALPRNERGKIDYDALTRVLAAEYQRLR